MITHAASRKQYTVLLDRPEAVFFIHIILASGAEVCGLDLLVCEKLFAGAGHGKAAGFKDIANVSGFQRHICVLLD